MTEDIDVWRVAKQYIDLYGEDALMQAMRRQSRLANNGDQEGAIVWQKIADKIEWLQMPENLTSETTH